MPRPTRLRSFRAWAGFRLERLRSPAIYVASSTLTRCRTFLSIPASAGLSSCSAARPIFPSPRARRVPRCRCVWPIWLLTCVTRTLLTLFLLPRLLGRRLVCRGFRLCRGVGDLLFGLRCGGDGQDSRDRQPAHAGHVLGAAELL